MNFNFKHIITAIIFFTLIACKSKKEEITISNIETLEVLVGTYTTGSSQGIYKLVFNPVDGSIENKGLVAEIGNPSYIIATKDNKYVYAVSENEFGEISAYKWNVDRSKLELINKLSVEGMHPCFAELNATEDMIAVANYSSGNITVFKLNSDGSLKEVPQIRQHNGKGTSLPRQDSPHAHCAKFYKDKFMYTVDLGLDEVASYSIDSSGDLGQKKTALKTDDGDGPRHLIVHPTKNVSYVINELSNSILVSEIDQGSGRFNRIQKISTLPQGFDGESFCADIHITKNGKFLYASNRGHNSIAIFSVDDAGKLTFLDTESVRGDWPRNFIVSPDDKFLLVANQKSDNIVVFSINQETGLLVLTEHELKISMPVCLKV